MRLLRWVLIVTIVMSVIVGMIYIGDDKMTGWTVGFKWMGDKEGFRNDILSGEFTRSVNAAGGFSMTMPLDDFALNLLGDTVVTIYYDGQPQFWGSFDGNHDIDEASDTVSITGGDMMDLLVLKKVDYQAVTALGADPPRGDQESKEVFEYLIWWNTGDTVTDSMFRNEYIERSETEYRYSFDGNTLLDALITVAQSCSLTIGSGEKHIGYACWVDGWGDIYLQPYGWRSYDKEISGFWKLGFDYSSIRNRIHLRGGIPNGWELSNADDEEQFAYDAFEENITPGSPSRFDNWAVTNGPGGGITANVPGNCPVTDYLKYNGNYGAEFATCTWVSSTPEEGVVLTRSFSPNLDWSYTDEGGNVQSTVQGFRYRLYSTKDHEFHVMVRIEDVDGDDYIWDLGMFHNQSVTAGQWEGKSIGLDVMSETGTMDWTSIDNIEISLLGSGSWPVTFIGDLYFDNFGIFFKEVDLWRRDEASIKIHGLKEVKFQDKRITDWKTAMDITDNLLELLKYPSVNASTTISYYDPDLHLNDLVTPEICGVKWPLYVDSLTVRWSGDHVSTDISAGRPVPSGDDILASTHILRDQDSEKGTGYQTADTYENTSCFKDLELFCRTDCMESNCQNAAQLLSCYTFVERNPCITACQRYKERTGWLNRILDQ